MQSMQSSPVISLSDARQRTSRIARAIDARRNLRPATERRRETSRGRIWLNGVQLGERAAAFSHLTETYD